MTLKREKGHDASPPGTRWQTAESPVPAKTSSRKKLHCFFSKGLFPFGCSYSQESRKKNLKPNWRETMQSLPQNSVCSQNKHWEVTEVRPQPPTGFAAVLHRTAPVTAKERRESFPQDFLPKGNGKQEAYITQMNCTSELHETVKQHSQSSKS